MQTVGLIASVVTPTDHHHLMNMHHTLHPKSNRVRLYLPRKIGSHELLQMQQVVEKRSLNECISTSWEKLLKVVKMENILKTTETKAQYKKQPFKNRPNSWKNRPLHGQHLRNIDWKHDHNSTWAWLKPETIKEETEGLIFTAQEQALQTNVMKAKIQEISANSKCRFF